MIGGYGIGEMDKIESFRASKHMVNRMSSIGSTNYRWVILSIVVSSQIVLSMGAFGWGPLAPFLKRAMSLSSIEIGTVCASFYFASALSGFPAGIIVDRYGEKRGMITWLALTGFPFLFLSFTHDNYFVFLIMVTIAGLGYGFGNPVASKILYIWFGDGRAKGAVFGLRHSSVTIGASAAGLLLVYISQRKSPFMALHTVFWMIMIMTALVLLLYRTPGRRLDKQVRMVQKTTESILSRLMGFFKNRELLIISFAGTMLGMAQGAFASFFPLYLNEEMGYSLPIAGTLFATVTISGTVGRVFWGILGDLLFDSNHKPTLSIIAFFTFVSLIVLAFLTKNWPRWLFIISIIGIGISIWGWNGIILLIVSEISGSSKTGITVGLTATFCWFGISLGPMIFGLLTHQFGYFCAWISLAVLIFLSLFLCFFITRSTSYA